MPTFETLDGSGGVHSEEGLYLATDVLVIGGGLAGAWAAIAAAGQGASVILADKGYCGTSGVTAAAGPGHWWVEPDQRPEAIRQRQARAFGLGDPDWMSRILEMTWRTLPTLAPYYRFPTDERGHSHYRALRGPEYLRALRQWAVDAGVTILDHCPALELLLHTDGSVAGAVGIQRQKQGIPWRVRAGAVILATGGCAFQSHLLGSYTNTGDGYLMAVEAGAELSGMEFSNYYTVAPAGSCQTRSASYAFARYFDHQGRELPIQWRDGNRSLARALLAGPVFCSLAAMPADLRDFLPQIQPALLMSFRRLGIDPFTERFPVTLRGEGTVRGTGGIRIVNDACETGVSGLFAAGDAATRELVAGATSGGGAQNSSWALSSGIWAGQGAAQLVRQRGRRAEKPVTPIGGAGLHPLGIPISLELSSLVKAIQSEMEPVEKNLFRSGPILHHSLRVLESLWQEIRQHLLATGVEKLKAREMAAMLATARWCYTAALARSESRGMHIREDHPLPDPQLAHRLVVGGLDHLWIAPDSALAEVSR